MQSKFSSGDSATGESPGKGALDGPDRLLGARILDFELVSVLGVGGMSVVYRARHPITLQEVAIKILPPELAVHDELKARFVEEARVLALLDHPNIVALNNFVEGTGRLCLVMQFVEGVTFEKQIVEGKRLPFPEVLRVGIEVLRALEYAHGRSVIHRDIKPSNILVRTDGVVKVTDFGIAKILGQSRLTSTGQTMGTVRYMSPEQVRGKGVDARSDLYSLGVTLFEGLAGVTPHDGSNQFEIMQKHLTHRPQPLEKYGVELPSNIEKALFRAMEKEPKNRFADAVQFRTVLEAELAVAESSPALGSRGRPARRARPAAAAFAMAAGVVVALGCGAAILVSKLRSRVATGISAVADPTAQRSRLPGPAPHVVPGVPLAADHSFLDRGVRVQSTRPLDEVDLEALASRVVAIERSFGEFLKSCPLAAARVAARAVGKPLPISLVLLPESVLNQADRWPGFTITADKTYPSRYVAAKRTLFVADMPNFERRELPFGVALHLLTPVAALSDAEVYELADQFATFADGHPL